MVETPMRACLVGLAGFLAACAVPTSPQPTRHTPEHPRSIDKPREREPTVQQVAQVAQVARDGCFAELPVLRRCVSPASSPGEPYLLHHGEGLRIIFRKVDVDHFGSLIRRLGPEDRWVVDYAPAAVRREILEHGTFAIACDRVPPDGVYYLDLCPLSVPPDACGTQVTATAATVVEIERAGERLVRMRPRSAPIQVSLSPDPAHPKCTFDLYLGPIHNQAP